jgi:CheY-like chemotaxis protein
VALTGWGQREDRQRTAEAGFDAHLVKPVTDTDLFLILTSSDADVQVAPTQGSNL